MGRPPELAPLRVRYQDYAALQRQRLSGEHQQELNAYWIDQLKDLEPLELPTDHSRPVTPSHRGDRVCFQIEERLLVPFEELCRGEGATLQMGLLAVVGVLLHRYGRQEDFAIGVPIWGRNHPELEKLIGFFINTLPIRMRFEPELSFRELLAVVRETSIGAYDHQELPFEQMVEALNVERDRSRNPVVQVMLQLMELPESSLRNFDGLQVEPLSVRDASAKVDLSFSFHRDSDKGLRGLIGFATDLFATDRIERLSSHLLTLLGSVLESPDGAVEVLNLLAEGERQLMESWQQGPVVELPELSVHELFEQQVERTPEGIALVFEGQEITYGEFNTRANALAEQLMDLGVGAGVVVAVCLERSIELIVAWLAILKAGGAYMPLEPSWPEERQRLLLKEAGSSLLLTAKGPEVIQSPHPVQGTPPGPPLAYVSYTSGSTGVPKGVAVGHAAILRLVHPVNGFLLGAGQRMLQLAPVAFDAATLEIWGPLLNGGTLVIAPAGQLTLQELAGVLRQERISTLWLTAGLFHAMVESELEALAGVQQVLAGGDVLSPAHVQRLLEAFPPGHGLINGYGPTEATTFTSCHRLAAGERVDGAGVPIGRPIAKTSVLVLEPCGQPCPIGVPGELHIGGAGLARGYLHQPELTAETFIADPSSPDPLIAVSKARLYKSGDLVSWNADGSLAFHGRMDGQIKLRGFRIEPGEIEAHLLAHAAVGQAVVVLSKEDPANPRLIAYWVARGMDSRAQADGSATSMATPLSTAEATAGAMPGMAEPLRMAEQLKTFLAKRLPDYMVPAAYVELAALPLTANGKLDRKALPAPSFSGDVQQRAEPTTDVERKLHAIWAEVLGHDEFGISDNFFAIGGHSLAAARLMAAIEQHFGMVLPIAMIFHAPEIGQMARLLETNANGNAEANTNINGRAAANAVVGDRCLVPLQSHGEATPLFVIHGYGGDVFAYTEFARALAPSRPVYGLQALGWDGSWERHRSVEEMAEHYAQLIDQHWPDGVVHLLGQSAGGWVVWAVAAELLRRGRRMGMVAILDSGPTAAISRRLRGSLLLRRTVRRIPMYARELGHSKRPRNVVAFLRERRQKLASHLRGFQPEAFSLAGEASAGTEDKPRGMDYFDLLHRRYRPGPLPLQVHLFLSRHDPAMKVRLWRAMACRGVVVRQLFEEHHHFHNPSLAEPLAVAIAETLMQIEMQIEAESPSD